jgi:hypothetical protein
VNASSTKKALAMEGSMRNYLVGLDLFLPARNQHLVASELERLEFVPIQRYMWAGTGQFEPDRLKRTLLGCLHAGDRLFIVDITDDDCAEHNLL